MIVNPPPEVPFEQTVADLFSLEGHTFLAYADRYSGWLEVERLSSSTFRHVRQSFLRWFSTYGVPEGLATDGGPPFNAHEYDNFLRVWDVNRRLSSAYYPQSNGRAEAAVKSAKRILLGNINETTGALDTDAAARALMTHRNTPAQDTGVSPAVMLFGRNLRDHLPQRDRKLRPEWNAVSDLRERAMAKRAVKGREAEGRELKPLCIGDAVQIQNQTGNHPGKWYSTGVITGVLPHRQYQVVVDGSRRVSLRNRRFLRKILPVSRKEFNPTPRPQPLPPFVPADRNPHLTPQLQGGEVEPVDTDKTCTPHSRNPQELQSNAQDDVHTNHELNHVPEVEILTPHSPEGLRRSGRVPVPRQPFSAKLKGKYHT